MLSWLRDSRSSPLLPLIAGHWKCYCTPMFKSQYSSSTKSTDNEWNDAWEAAWLPNDINGKDQAPWEKDVNFPSTSSDFVLPTDVDTETKAFVEEMSEKWTERRKDSKSSKQMRGMEEDIENNNSLYSLENMKQDYRLKKQRIHASLWLKEIEKRREEKLGSSSTGGVDDIDKLLDGCSEIFDAGSSSLGGSGRTTSMDFNNKPDGWETASRAQDGSIWEMSQIEEDILLQEFDRRIAYSKFQIASFIKSHIFSRRRPIDGWKYMIEEIGPNARKHKGNVTRIPALSESSTQPFREDKTPPRTHKG